jgi:hypothetical protein
VVVCESFALFNIAAKDARVLQAVPNLKLKIAFRIQHRKEEIVIN